MRSILFERNKSSEDAVTLPGGSGAALEDKELIECFGGSDDDAVMFVPDACSAVLSFFECPKKGTAEGLQPLRRG